MRHRVVDGAALRQIRLDRELRVPELAEKAGVSASFIKYVEAGQTQPSDLYARALADALGVTVEEFSAPKTAAA